MITHHSVYKLGSEIVDVYLQINPYKMNRHVITITGLISTILKLIQIIWFGQCCQYLILVSCLYEITNP